VGKAARAESAIEKEGALSAAAAREADVKAIKDERDALIQLGAAARLANVQSLYGGRSSMEQHLSDEQQEINLTTLLNRQKWLGFSSPQQAYAWRQQEYNQLLLMNRAQWAGYTTPDQYLQYLVRYRTGLDALNAVMRERLGLFEDTAAAASTMNQNMGQGKAMDLGEQIAGLQAFSNAVNAVPDTQITSVTVDDSAGIAELARWNAILRGVPDKKVTTIEVIRAAYGMGGVSVDRPTPLIYPRPAPDVAPRPVLGLGGGAGGGGGGPPPVAAAAPSPEEPIPGGAAGLAAGAEGGAAALKDESAAAKAALANLYQLAAAETDAGRQAQIGSAINAIYSASIKGVKDEAKDAGDASADAAPKLKLLTSAAAASGVAALAAGGWWGAWTRDIRLFAGAFGTTAMVGGISVWLLALHFLIDAFIVAVPAIVAASAALGAFALAAEPAALDVIAHVTGIHTALDALGTGADQLGTDHVGPLTTKMGSLDAQMKPMPVTIRSIQAAMAPTVVTLYGAAFSSLGSHMGLVQQIAQKTGTFIEDMVVKAQLALAANSGKLQGLINTATADMKILMSIGESVLKVFFEFVQAGQITHVAEDVFSALAYILADLQKVLHGIGPDVLAAGIAFFSLVHYGGLLVTVAQNLLLGFTRLLSVIPGLGNVVGKLAPLFGASNDQLIKMNQLTPQMRQMADYFAKNDSAAIGMANSLKLTEDQLIKVVGSNQGIADMASKFGISKDAAAANAIAITASGKSAEQYAIDSGNMSARVEELIAGLSEEDKAFALVGVSAVESAAEAEAGVAAMTVETEAATVSVGLLGGAWKLFTAWFAANPLGAAFLALAALVTAIILVARSWDHASSSVNNFVSGMQAGLTSLNASDAFAQIPKNIAAIGVQLDQTRATARNAIGNMAAGWSEFMKGMTGSATQLNSWKEIVAGLWKGISGESTTPGNIAKLTAEQTAEMKDWSNEMQAAGDTANKYGVTVAQAFSLMDLAGVKAGDSLAVQKTKVDDLVSGWINMGVTGLNTADGMNRLGGAIDSVTLSSEIQNSQIGTLTQSYTTFLSLVTGGQTAFETFATGVNTIGTNAKATGASMTGLNAASLTLRQSWESQLSAGQQLYNNLVLQNAAAGNNKKSNDELTASGKDIVNNLLEQGGATTEVTNGAYALAQTMGYMGTNNYNALLKWSGGNQTVSGTTADLNKQVGLLQTGSANLDTDVKNLAAAINTNLNQAIAQGLIDMPKMVNTVSQVRDAVIKSRGDINKGIFAAPVVSSGQALYNALVAVYGTTPTGLAQAKAQFETVYIDLGIHKEDADKLWASITGQDQKPKPVKIPPPDTSGVEAKLRAMNHDFATPPSPSAWQRFVAAAMAPPSVHNFLVFFQTIGGLFDQYVLHYILMAWQKIYTGFFNDFQHPLSDFFNKTIPNFVVNTIRLFDGMWSNVAHYFGQYLVSDVGNFFTKTFPTFMADVGKGWLFAWTVAWHVFDSYIIQPMANFFTKTIPQWLADVGTWFRNLWNTVWSDFNKYWLQPAANFFTKTMPNWLGSLGSDFLNLWKTVWNDFSSHVLSPMGNWFSNTLPNAIKNSFRDSINWVINNTINKVINFLNNDVLAHLPGTLKISTVQNVAAGGDIGYAYGSYVRYPHAGSVPGASAVDGTPIMAMGGEYMLRQPARMALDRAFGSDFLGTLNQADSWLGSGSRGTPESQKGRAAFPFPAQTYATGGEIVAAAEKGIGVPYVYGGTSPSGWDCSGFVQYILQELGWRNVPRTSEAQYGWTSRTGNPTVGGLVFAQFPGDNAPPGHVGFYIGNGQVLSARDPAAGTGIDPLSSWSGHIVGYGNEPNATGLIGQIFGGITGFFTEAWQSVEGLLDSAGQGLGDLIKPLANLAGLGGKELLTLAKSGAKAIFDWIWGHTIQPMMKDFLGDTAPGAVVQALAAKLKSGVDSFMGSQDTSAQNTAAAAAASGGQGLINPVSGPADAGPGQAESYAQSQLGAHGWNAGQFSPLQQLWTKESGWNRFARNPSSGAYGIAQALPPSKYPPAAQAGGGSHASPQIDWGMNYIAGRYGSPSGAWSHEVSNNWYLAGGPVIAAIKNAVRDPRTQEAMALASYMDTRWNAGYDWQSLYGAFAQPASKTITSAQWRNVGTAVRDLLPKFQSGVSWVYPNIWKNAEYGAELAAEHALGRSYRPTSSQWATILSALGSSAATKVPGPTGTKPYGTAPKPTAPGAVGSALPGNVDPETAWLTYSATNLPQAVNAEVSAFWNLNKMKLPKTATEDQWAQWYADLLIMQEQQRKTIGLGASPAGAYMALSEDFVRPETITPGMWTTLGKDLDTLISWNAGPGIAGGADPPSSAWGYEKSGPWPKNLPRNLKPGSIKPSAWPGWKYLNSGWSTLRTSLLNLKSTLQTAWTAWDMLYAGQGIAGGVPGPGVAPATGINWNLGPLVTRGGPDEAVFDLSVTSGVGAGYGFAGGGEVPDMAGMFAPGGPVYFMPSGVSPQLVSSMSAASGFQGEAPRTISDAASAIRGVGLNVESMTINNPVSEQPSQSIARASNRLAFLAGRGLA
jgi:hypothetical protein